MLVKPGALPFIAKLKESFTLLDKNGDGIITKEELNSVLFSFGVRSTVLELKAMIRTVDTDKSGTIDFDEFMQIFQTKLSVDPEMELHEVFSFFDKDKDGGISPGELYEVLTKLGEVITESFRSSSRGSVASFQMASYKSNVRIMYCPLGQYG
ncbi:hypothetical protein CHS0354_038561 [Potamilus streckersoni]|uniref:EF-hand domain-containing protein n=1 Tax=Potamilus streckersoni TaxID=2493646 RepID=A0AAE0RRX9_9BIVA|nr:hypothetical protein CHS0354_038561 [Potamilus streckersoni]